MQLHKLAFSSLILHAVTWACMQFPDLACSYMRLHAVTWACMSLHRVPWACMQLHKLACSSFLRLSSSQEFRSACFYKILTWTKYMRMYPRLSMSSLRLCSMPRWVLMLAYLAVPVNIHFILIKSNIKFSYLSSSCFLDKGCADVSWHPGTFWQDQSQWCKLGFLSFPDPCKSSK